MPLLHSLRGGGLANEAIPWAKAFIGARELGLRCLHPAWGLNPRGYSGDFGRSRLDVLAYPALLGALPTYRITYEMVRATGEDDYALALRALAPELGLPRKRPVVVTHETMDGGWIGIWRARDFLLREFLRPAHVPADLYRIGHCLDPERLTVAVHLRFGDFTRTEHGPSPGTYNEVLPDGWYEAVVDGILDAFAGQVQAVLVTDDSQEPAVCRLLERPGVLLPPPRSRPLLSDLLTLVGADLLICSVSAFSQLAAFLSDAPYVWFQRHLNDHDGWYSIWGHEEKEQLPRGITGRHLRDADATVDAVAGRGFASDGGPVQPELFDLLERRLWLKQRRRDLVYGGVIRRLIH